MNSQSRSRMQLVLGGALLLQLLLILALRSPLSRASAPAETRPLLPALAAITPSRLEVDGSGSEQLVLVRQGETWKIEDLGGFPADGAKVKELLDDLKALKVRRPVVSSSRYHKAFKVAEDDREARLRLWDEGQGDPKVDLFVGSSANYRTTHVRVGGSADVYEVQGLASYDVQPTKSGWIEKELVHATPEQVDRLELHNAKGAFELAKADGTWKVQAPDTRKSLQLDQGKVDSLVRVVTALRLADAAGALNEDAQGLRSPAATVRLGWTAAGSEEHKDGEENKTSTGEATVEVGGKVPDKDNQRYVTRSGFGFTGTVWDNSLKRLVEEGLDELTPSAKKG